MKHIFRAAAIVVATAMLTGPAAAADPVYPPGLHIGIVPLQGNLNPALLAAPWPVLEARLRQVLESGAEAPAHVLNLGHGVPPDTDPGVLTRIVDLVHSETVLGEAKYGGR